MVDGMIAVPKAEFAVDGLDFILGEGASLGADINSAAQSGTPLGKRVFSDLERAAIPDIPG